MRAFVRLLSLVIGFAVAVPAYADAHYATSKHSVENGVKVYRNALTPDQAALRAARQHAVLADIQARQAEAKRAKYRSQAKARQQNAYNAGFHEGFKGGTQAERARQRANCGDCNRRRIRLRQRIRTRPFVSGDVLRRRNLQ